jgi:anti-anti-sigma factor
VTNDEIRSADFKIDVKFNKFEVVLAISGDLDATSAPELDAIFDAILNRGHDSMVLDLSGLGFMDGRGLRVIANAAHCLESYGAVLVLQSPSAEIRRILNINGLDALIQLDFDSAGQYKLGSKQPAVARAARSKNTPNAGSTMVMPRERELLDSALHLVITLASMVIGCADGVSVSLLRDGHIMTVAASNQTILKMDASQYATREGPCLDASIEGRWFHVNSLDEETRWPAFIPLAKTLGIGAILSNPLHAQRRPVGALNIYSSAVAAFGQTEQELAAAFAAETSVILSHAGFGTSDAALARRLQGALRSREVIAQAQGVMMERASVGEDAAFDFLRRISQQSARPLRERAEHIIASTRRPESEIKQNAGSNE